jgi:hypothetical protein
LYLLQDIATRDNTPPYNIHFEDLNEIRIHMI